MPVGGYKGVGMTVLVDILCSALSLNGLSCDVIDADDYEKTRKIGHFFMALNIADFADLLSSKTFFRILPRDFIMCPKCRGGAGLPARRGGGGNGPPQDEGGHPLYRRGAENPQ